MLRACNLAIPLALLTMAFPAFAQSSGGHPFDATTWDSGSRRWVAHFDEGAARMRGYWEDTDELFLDVTVGVSELDAPGVLRLFGEFRMDIGRPPGCPNLAEAFWVEFEGTVSPDGLLIQGRNRLLSLNLATCEAVPSDEWGDLTWRRAEMAVGLCPVPDDLMAAVERLELSWTEYAQRRSGLPSAAMFRRASLDPEEAAVWDSLRVLVDQQIANAGPDDWLQAAGMKGGSVRRFLNEITPLMDGSHCDRGEWQALADRLATIAREFDNQRTHIHNVYLAVRTNHEVWGREVLTLMSGIRSADNIVTDFFEALGMSNDDAVTASQVLALVSVIGKLATYLADEAVGPIGGPIAAILVTIRAVRAEFDWIDLTKVEEDLLPFFLENAEQLAWLQPLDDWYTDLADDQRIIIQFVREYQPVQGQ